MASIKPASLHAENASKSQRTHKEETPEIQISKCQTWKGDNTAEAKDSRCCRLNTCVPLKIQTYHQGDVIKKWAFMWPPSHEDFAIMNRFVSYIRLRVSKGASSVSYHIWRQCFSSVDDTEPSCLASWKQREQFPTNNSNCQCLGLEFLHLCHFEKLILLFINTPISGILL